MQITRDVWLSETLQRPAFAVHAAGDDGAGATEALQASDAAHPGAFYFSKVPILDLAGVRSLTTIGFSVAETSLTFARPIATATEPAGDSGHVSVFDPRWTEPVLDIAASCFRFSRFHVDPGIQKAAADRVKREWIRSYVEGRRGDVLLVSHDGGVVTGFAAMLVVERPAGSVAVIDLIGVRTDQQQRGVGRALVQAACDHYAARCGTMEVGTQASNVPSVRMYERAGFRLIRSGFVLHRHGTH